MNIVNMNMVATSSFERRDLCPAGLVTLSSFQKNYHIVVNERSPGDTFNSDLF